MTKSNQEREKQMTTGSHTRKKLFTYGPQTGKSEKAQILTNRNSNLFFSLLQQLVQKEITWQKSDQRLSLKQQKPRGWQRNFPASARLRAGQRQRKNFRGRRHQYIFEGRAFGATQDGVTAENLRQWNILDKSPLQMGILIFHK